MSRVTEAVTTANRNGRLALAVFVTAGFPDKKTFPDVMAEVASLVDILEIGVPFSDPMADGVSIQHASHEALRAGVTLPWILETIEALRTDVPVVLMSYINPLLAYGIERLAEVASRIGVAGLIIPDLPFEEAGSLRDIFHERDVDLIQLVTPTTPQDRLERICEFSSGFVYAVTMTGTTGGDVSRHRDTADYLTRVRRATARPVMAGFGIRKPEHITPLAGHVDGVIVGSALTDVLRQGENPRPFLQALRAATHVVKEVPQ